MAFALRAFITTTLLIVAPVVSAAPGALDPTFGTGGAVAPVAAGANAIAIRPDGKVLVAGWTGSGFSSSPALMSYNADGSVDTSFGSAGIVPASMTSYAIALQPDGKVVTAGTAMVGFNNAIVLERHNADGSLDTGFGTNGVVTTSSGDIGAQAVALQRDGKVVVTGLSSGGEFFVVRYNANGSLDTGFGTNGVATASSGANDEGWAIAVQSDGKVVVAGRNLNADLRQDMALVRFNANGTLDTGFGPGGIVIIHPNFYDSIFTAIALQPDGKLLAGGYNYASGYSLARFNTDGSADTSFGTSGFATAPGTGYCNTTSIALQPDGSVLAIGSTCTVSTYGVTLMRFGADGSLDSSFGTSGLVTSTGVAGAAIAIQPDGKLVAGGYETGSGNLVVKRYIASDTTWDLTPDAVTFTDRTGVALRSTVTSDTVNVSGLDTGLEVPLQISGGSYSLNGGAYTNAMGWVKKGDTITVRQTASPSPSTANVATLTIGGLVAANSTSAPLGTTISATFTSTTTATAPGSGGGGAFNLASLLLLGLLGARRRAGCSV